MIICVTGQMASGKNFVTSLLEKRTFEGRAFACVDADKLVHTALENAELIEKIKAEFGKIAEERGIEIVNSDGKLNRRNLGAILFSDPELIQKQEQLVHPYVEKMISDFINEHKNENVILNATVLYKIDAVKKCDKIIFVTAPLITRFIRAKRRDKMKTMQIFQRFWSQRQLFSKYYFLNADIVRVDNAGNLKRLKCQLDKIFPSD